MKTPTVLAALFLFVMIALRASAKDPDEDLKDLLFPFYGREAAEYDFVRDEKREQKLELQKTPVLTWTNVENYRGAVFIWTHNGRPEVIGCIGSHQLPNKCVVFHEFHSLSTQPLPAVKFGRGKEDWTPSKPGLEFKPVDAALAPADSERLRLTQMRNIAREFTGWMQDNQDVTELRLLPQPLVRYKDPGSGIVDGAIFSMVWKGTDPEILMVLEDRKGAEGESWQFALARFNFRDLWVKRNGKEVWRVGVSARNEVYITGVTGETTLARIRESAPKSEAK